MALTDITREAVLLAAGECDELGRDAFLARYGFRPAHSYFLDLGGRRYDSKAIAGAAHGFLPGRSPLTAREFSGGRDHAAKVLRGLGFRIVDGGPAATGITADELVRRVAALRVAHTDSGPRLYQAVTLLWAAGRALRGEPRVAPWRETGAELARLLALHGMRGERPRPDFPVLALFHAELWTLQGYAGAVPPAAHGDARLRRWFEEQQPDGGLVEPVYELLRTSGVARIACVEAVVERFFDGLDEVPLLTDVGLFDATVADDAAGGDTAPSGAPGRSVVSAAQYEKLCALVDRRERSIQGKRRPAVTNDPIRSAAARRAVIERSEGACENPGCGGQPADRTDRGLPILDVDHITEITAGGRDHPSQMIALCPNCHAVKTRGSTRHTLTETLREVAARLHREASAVRNG
jgi:5-methylcytosine-specific restriction protein A